MQLARARGFTLTELAVVMVIIAFLMVGGMMTFNAQVDQRNHDETLRRLNTAVDAILAFAVVNRRLPCPAVGGATGVEAFGVGGTTAAGGPCSTNFNGFLPAETIGFGQLDANRYGVDAWNSRIRYAVASTLLGGSCTGTSTTPHFTSVANLRANGMTCRPGDLDVCTTAACAARVVSVNTAVLVVFSTGRNGALTNMVGDELENTDGDALFVSRTQGGTGDPFDDLMVVVPVGVLYQRLISAGVLP